MIKKIKISFLWVKSFPEIFEYDHNVESKYVYKDYCSLVELLANLASTEGNYSSYSYPWLELGHNNFWKQYLQCKPENKLGASILWDYLVPIFYKIKANVKFRSEAYGVIKATVEPYLYHHGIGLVMNVHVPLGNSGIGLNAVEKLAHDLYNSCGYEIILNENESYGNCSLNQLSNILMNMLAKEIMDTDHHADAPGKPFTVITIIEGEKENASKAQMIKGIENIFRSINQTFEEAVPISGYEDTPDLFCKNLIFSSKRSRIIWCPKAFLKPGSKNNSLGCYHKNITRLSMQIESLADILKNFMSLRLSSEYLCTYAGNAQHQLVKFYNFINPNIKTTYYSASAVVQINQNEYVGLINLMRDKMGISRKVESIQTKEVLRKNSIKPSHLYL